MKTLLTVVGIVACSVCVGAPGHAASVMNIDIPAQLLDKALYVWAEQTGFQVLISQERSSRDALSPAIRGSFTPEQALRALLGSADVTYEFVDRRTVAIRAGSPPQSSAPLRLAASSSVAGAENGASKGVDEDRPSRSGLIPEIVVTATKRKEKIEDIPMSISAITQTDVDRRGLIGMEDYLRSIPGVSQIDVGPQSNAIIIRGITTSPQSENFYSGATVGTYFDETPITAAAGLGAGGIDVRPVDVERIEVLRGPQGTAYGSASLGGTLRIIPAKPELDRFSGKVAAALSDTSGFGGNNSMVQGVANIPLVSGKLALRAVGYRFNESGVYRNIGGSDPALLAMATTYGLANVVRDYRQDDVGQVISTGGRLAALWQATDALDLSVSFLTQTIGQDGWPNAQIGTFEQARMPVSPQARVRGNEGEASYTKTHLVNLVVNYDLGWAKSTSAVSRIEGGSGYAQDLSGAFRFPASSTIPSEFKSVTAETRLASQFTGPVQFLAGLYYESVDDDYQQTLDSGAAAFGTAPLFLSRLTREVKQRAAFGELSYELLSNLTATVGGRYFKYDADETDLSEGSFVRIPIGTGVPQNISSDENHSSFKADLSYKPTQDSLLYASWAQGFRLGKPQPGLPATCDANRDGLVDGTSISLESTRKVNSDFLDNYEVGAKATVLDRRLSLSTAIYHITWNEVPIGTVAGTCPLGYTANVGAAKSEGIEAQATIFPIEGLRFDIGAGYSKAELTRDAPSLSAKKGARLPGSPKLSGNFATQYDFTLLARKAFVRADFMYVGKFYGNLAQTEASAAGDYTKIDARTGIEFNSLSAELFVKNLTNEDEFTWRTSSPTTSFYGYRMRPRTFGVQLGYKF